MRKPKLVADTTLKICKRNHTYPPNGGEGCPECRKLTLKQYHERRKLDPEYLKYHNKQQKKYYNKVKTTSEAKLAARANRLKTRYWPNLNMWQALAEYERMLAEQDYCCKICEVHVDLYKNAFHVDHCHKTSKVRGLLCAVCNRYIVGGIDIRAKAKAVGISKAVLVDNVLKYFKECDPEYIASHMKYELNKKDKNEKS